MTNTLKTKGTMKNLIFFIMLFFLLSSIPSNAQTDEDRTNLKTDIEILINAYQEDQYEKIVTYLPDFIFKDISKEKIINELSKSPKAKVPDINQFKIDTIIKIQSIQYARIRKDPQNITYAIKKRDQL